jgi:CheY-like chemotaxis protein
LDAIQSLRLYLQISGCQVETATDGQAALDLAARYRPDVALLDLGMPRLDGLDVARRIRREPWGRDMTLVAITGWGQDEDRKRSREAGFDYHLVKPVAPVVLADVLAKRSDNVRHSGEG